MEIVREYIEYEDVFVGFDKAGNEKFEAKKVLITEISHKGEVEIERDLITIKEVL